MGLYAKVIGLLVLFTAIEDITLIYWLVYGNSAVGIVILTIGLTAEHALSLVAGVLAGRLLKNG